MKTTSRFAVLAAAGFFISGYGPGTAMAADLGGDCCADLEERVAELEATTVRKRKRQLSMTISGRVHAAVVHWNDGGANPNSFLLRDQDTFVTTPSGSSRVSIDGRAVIRSGLEAGYRFRFKFNANARGITWSQFNRPGDGDGIREDEIYWFIRSASLGAISVGRRGGVESGAGKVDISGKVGLPGQIDPRLWGGAIRLRTNDGFATNVRLRDYYQADDGDGEATERNGVRYDSPSWAGFIISADWQNFDNTVVAGSLPINLGGTPGAGSLADRDRYAVRLSYANQWGNFRIAGAGAWWTDDSKGNSSTLTNFSTNDANGWVASGGIMHVPTGLFINGGGGRTDFDGLGKVAGGNLDDKDAKFAYITGGWQSKFWSPGSTTLFGTYYWSDNNSICGGGILNATQAAACNVGGTDFGNATAVAGVVDEHEATYWGLGVVQSIDAASMDLYFSYRRFDTELNASLFGQVGDFQDYDVYMAGGIINF